MISKKLFVSDKNHRSGSKGALYVYAVKRFAYHCALHCVGFLITSVVKEIRIVVYITIILWLMNNYLALRANKKAIESKTKTWNCTTARNSLGKRQSHICCNCVLYVLLFFPDTWNLKDNDGMAWVIRCIQPSGRHVFTFIYNSWNGITFKCLKTRRRIKVKGTQKLTPTDIGFRNILALIPASIFSTVFSIHVS